MRASSIRVVHGTLGLIVGAHAALGAGCSSSSSSRGASDAGKEGSTAVRQDAGDAAPAEGGGSRDGGGSSDAATKSGAVCKPEDVFVAPWFQIAGGGGTRDTTNGDLNNDGLTDVVTLGGGASGSSFTVNLNKGMGSFATATSYRGPAPSGEGIAVGDIDGDGYEDIVYSGLDSESRSGVAVALNEKDGTFATPILYGTEGLIPESLGVYDVNHDGKLDVVMAAQIEATAGDGFYVLLNSGGGKLGAPIHQPAALNPAGLGHAFSLADLDDDGNLDVAFFDGSGACVALGNGDGTFQKPTCTTGAGDAVAINAIAVGDLDGDHKPDIVLFNYGTMANSADVYLNSGKGTFPSFAGVMSAGGGTLDGVLLDWNHDGNLDIVRYDGNALLIVSLGNGDGTFQADTVEAAFSDGDANGGSILPGDYLGNGLQGFATATFFPPGFEVLTETCRTTIAAPASVLPPTKVAPSTCASANVSLSAVTKTNTVSTYEGARAADVDGDGKVDLLQLGGKSSGGRVLVPAEQGRRDVRGARGCRGLREWDGVRRGRLQRRRPRRRRVPLSQFRERRAGRCGAGHRPGQVHERGIVQPVQQRGGL